MRIRTERRADRRQVDRAAVRRAHAVALSCFYPRVLLIGLSGARSRGGVFALGCVIFARIWLAVGALDIETPTSAKAVKSNATPASF